MSKKINILTNGLLKENPSFVQMLGMCPTLAVTVSAINGFGMGMATTAVLIMSNVAISALRKVIPAKIRIPAFIVVIATAVTIVGMLMETYVSSLYEVLGLFIPLIVVNCIILARAEAFAFENGVLASAMDGIGMGLGFTLSLTILGIVREFFGEFKFFGHMLFGKSAEPCLIFIQPPGAFLTLALLLAMYNQFNISKAKKKKAIEDAERKARKEAELAAAQKAEEERERKRLEREKKKAEAAAQKAAEEAAKKAEDEANGSSETVKDEKTESVSNKEEPAKEMTPEEQEAERKRLKREAIKAKQAEKKAEEEAKKSENEKSEDSVKASDEMPAQDSVEKP